MNKVIVLFFFMIVSIQVRSQSWKDSLWDGTLFLTIFDSFTAPPWNFQLDQLDSGNPSRTSGKLSFADDTVAAVMFNLIIHYEDMDSAQYSESLKFFNSDTIGDQIIALKKYTNFPSEILIMDLNSWECYNGEDYPSNRYVDLIVICTPETGENIVEAIYGNLKKGLDKK